VQSTVLYIAVVFTVKTPSGPRQDVMILHTAVRHVTTRLLCMPKNEVIVVEQRFT